MRLRVFLVLLFYLSGSIKLVECQLKLQTILSCDDQPDLVSVDIPASLTYDKKKITFSLSPGLPYCGNQTYLQTIKIPNALALEDEIGSEIRYFLADGSLRVGNEYFNNQEYCLKKSTKTAIVVQICNINCGVESTCIPKCCEIGKSFDVAKNRCSFTGEINWNPPHQGLPNIKSGTVHPKLHPHYFLQNLKCSDPELWSSATSTKLKLKSVPFRVLASGNTVYLDQITKEWRTLLQDSYCLDDVISSGESISISTKTEMLALCPNSIDSEIRNDNIVISIIYGLVMFVSCGIYVVTIVVHIILWNKQKFHMYIVISYVVSLLLLHIFFGTSNIVQLEALDSDLNGTIFCVVIGAASHIFILSTFCWLTMINLNLWSTFSSLNVPHGSSSEGRGIERFIYFSLFSWGLPIVVVVGGLTLDNLNKNNEDISILGPSYGETRCLISTEAEGWYLFYPIGILLVCNALFFCLTVGRLCVYQKITRNVIGERSDRKWRIVNVYLRLLTIAVILWAFELISWILTEESQTWYWLVVDLFNLVQSAVIFTLFVCRKSIHEQLQKKFPFITKCESMFSSACCCGEEAL